MKNLNQTSFPNRAVKTFSVATHLIRGIILFTRKGLRWGTSDSMKLSKWDYVNVLSTKRSHIYNIFWANFIPKFVPNSMSGSMLTRGYG